MVLLPHFAQWPIPVTVVGFSIAIAITVIYRSPFLWFGVTGFLITRMADWTTVNEHDLLAMLWALTLALAFSGTQPERTMARAGALLLGLAFTFAFFGKATSPDFASGNFFRFSMAADPRFELVADWAGGIDDDSYEEVRAEFVALRAHADAPRQIAVREGDRASQVASVMAIGALLIEGAVAMAFLWPSSSNRIHTVRAATLLTFCIAAYALVPVVQFGLILLLIAMGCAPEGRRIGLVYVAAFGALIAWSPIWQWLIDVY